jgi:DNA-binding NarL/FixJ family response regulator
MPNFLLVDDHSMIRTGLMKFIETFLPQTKFDEANDGDSAFEKIKQNDYDLVIMDVNMPNTDSLGLLSNVIALKPKSRVLMFSMNAEELFAKRYLKVGAMGYLKKDETDSEIRKAVTNVLNNKRYISPSLSEKLLADYQNDNMHENPFDKLSTREFEIVQHLSRGESLAEICEKLNLHSSTVGTHKARIFQKLQCKNVVELSELAKEHKILPPS